jgi:selenophosphate synthetase-related protein
LKQEIKEIVESVVGYAGVLRKQPIQEVFETLNLTHQYGNQLPNYGDDAAVIPFNGQYLLLAADGMMTRLLVNEPYAAGKASVMVTVNDIYAMGGRPLGLVNVLASGEAEQRLQIVKGIEKGCRKLQVPMIGGHLHPDAPQQQPSLSVAILGTAQKLLRTHLAETGDNLILAVDLTGRAGCYSVISWDANSGKSPKELLSRLEVMPQIAEQGLACAAKDISNAGILGTMAIMMENSNKGAVIDLSAIPKPDAIELSDWILCFQSFGFVLAVAPDRTQPVLELFANQHITAQVVGKVVSEPVVSIQANGVNEVLFDFRKDAITGIRYTQAER